MWLLLCILPERWVCPCWGWASCPPWGCCWSSPQSYLGWAQTLVCRNKKERFFLREVKRERAMLPPPSTKFVLFLPSSHHSVHRVGAVWRHCKAADCRCGVHEVAVSKCCVMRCCISSKGEHSHCERVAGGVLWWNSMHLVPPKQTQTFHFRWAKKGFVYSPWVHLLCSIVGRRLQTKDIKLVPLTKRHPVRDKTPSGLLMLYFEPGAFWSEATGVRFVWPLAI